MASYITYDLAMVDSFNNNKAMTASGGRVYVTSSGGTRKSTLYNPDAGFAALTNPFVPSNGRIRFSVLSTATFGQDSQPTVDVYGISGEGVAFQKRGVNPGNPDVVRLDNLRFDHMLMVPFNLLDTVANTETDTLFDFPVGSIISPDGPSIYVTTAEASRTISFGLLSSESGGNATGFVTGLSVATAGVSRPTMANGAITVGALLQVLTTGGTVPVPQSTVISTAVSLTYTLSASSASAAGLIQCRYRRMIPPA